MCHAKEAKELPLTPSVTVRSGISNGAFEAFSFAIRTKFTSS